LNTFIDHPLTTIQSSIINHSLQCPAEVIAAAVVMTVKREVAVVERVKVFEDEAVEVGELDLEVEEEEEAKVLLCRSFR
jgi:hypothetical protein